MATSKGGSGWRAVFISSNIKNSGYPSIPFQSLGSFFNINTLLPPRLSLGLGVLFLT